jgi:hypothetical protein
MDDIEAAKWFEAVFVGEWTEVPPDLAAPDWIVEESRQWADIFLDSEQNPYRRLGHRQQLYLGQASAPDKMVTTLGDASVIETRQHFILTRQVAGSSGIKAIGDALEAAQRALWPFLSTAARIEVDAVVEAARYKEIVETAVPMVLASPVHSPGTVRSWQDKVNLIWYQDKPYVDFYKTYTEFATFIYQTGLDWFPQEWREQLGVPR